MKKVVIAGFARSPFAPAKKGELASVRPDDLAAQVVAGLANKTGVRTDDIEDLISAAPSRKASRAATWLASSA